MPKISSIFDMTSGVSLSRKFREARLSLICIREIRISMTQADFIGVSMDVNAFESVSSRGYKLT